MPASVDAGDRKLLIISGSLLAAIGLIGFLVAPGPEGPQAGFPSSYSTIAGGGKAAYLLLENLGYRVERWTASPVDLPRQPRGVVLVEAMPAERPTAEEASLVRDFVRNGGTLLATDASSTAFLPERQVVPTREPVLGFQKFAAQKQAWLTRDAPEILMRSNFRWDPKAPATDGEDRPYGDKNGPVVVTYRFGRGSVVWWADSTPLTNYGLTQSANLMFFLNSITPSDGSPRTTRVLWDEYYHGDRASLWSYLARTPAPWALLQLGIMAVAALLTFARRSGPVRPLSRESRLSPLEFIDTLGGLYQRKGAAREGLEIAYHRFRFMLLGRLGLPASSTVDDIARGVRERLGWTVPGFWETLERAERGAKSGPVTEQQAMRLVQELHDYSRRFRFDRQGGG